MVRKREPKAGQGSPSPNEPEEKPPRSSVHEQNVLVDFPGLFPRRGRSPNAKHSFRDVKSALSSLLWSSALPSALPLPSASMLPMALVLPLTLALTGSPGGRERTALAMEMDALTFFWEESSVKE